MGTWLASAEKRAYVAKVTIRSDHGRQPQLAHDREAGAVGERKVPIAILEKEVPRSSETIGVDTLPSQPGAAINLPPPCVRSCEPETDLNQRQRLVDDEVGRDQNATGLERGVTDSSGGGVCRITFRARAAIALAGLSLCAVSQTPTAQERIPNPHPLHTIEEA